MEVDWLVLLDAAEVIGGEGWKEAKVNLDFVAAVFEYLFLDYNCGGEGESSLD